MANNEELNEYELQILRECAGEIDKSPWGAAVGAVLEYLRGSGYLSGSDVTPKGAKALEENPP